MTNDNTQLAEGQTIAPGATGPAVTAMQEQLCVEPTGVHKGESVEKVNALRKAQDLPENGVFAPALLAKPTRKAPARKADDGDPGDE